MLEVEEIPLDIEEGSTFTFTKSIGSKVNTVTHAIHDYPAKFIKEFPKFGIKYSGINKGLLFDPFNGSGTSLLESKLAGIDAIGLDINPLSKLITEAKVKITNQKELEMVESDGLRIVECALDLPIPDLTQQDDDVDIMENYNFWFPIECIQDLIRLKRAIVGSELISKYSESFYLTILSSIVKKVSYWKKGQIKVRKDEEKFKKSGIPSTIEVFKEHSEEGHLLIKKLISSLDGVENSTQDVIIGTATEIAPDEIDLIVTSPPYINAIDYTMNHKFSLFVLNLISTNKFKDHCREYIGVTERAVRKIERDQVCMFESKDGKQLEEVFKEINSLNDNIGVDGSDTSKIRQYITYTYFRDMHKSICLWYERLKPGGLCMIVVGPNNIRGVEVPTHELIRDLMSLEGFEIELTFFHSIHSRSLQSGRNTNAGIIDDEMVIVARKPS